MIPNGVPGQLRQRGIYRIRNERKNPLLHSMRKINARQSVVHDGQV